MLDSTLFFDCLLLKTLFLLFFAIYLVNVSAGPILWDFNLEQHHSYFAFCFMTNVDLFYYFFWSF